MTTALNAPSRPDVLAGFDTRFISNHIASLGRSVRQYRAYRHALAVLRKLSVRELDDLGFAGLDLSAIARKAAERA